MKSICVFCGATFGSSPLFKLAAESLGAALGQRKLQLIYGGRKVGLMGAVADAALAAGVRVTGIIPDFLHAREVYHRGIQELIIVKSMHERKLEMAKRADAFIALPGGFGTFEELFEVITWAQLNIHKKPIGLLNVAGYYDHLAKFLDHSVEAKFINPESRQLLKYAENVDELLAELSPA